MFIIDKGELLLSASAKLLPVYKTLEKHENARMIKIVLIYTFFMYSKRGYHSNNPFKDKDFESRKLDIHNTFKEEFSVAREKMPTYDDLCEKPHILSFFEFYKRTQITATEVLKENHEKRLAGWLKLLNELEYGDAKGEKEIIETIQAHSDTIDELKKIIETESQDILLNEECPLGLFELPESQKPKHMKIINAL